MPDHNDIMADDFVVGGKIGAQWHARGATGGPFGPPMGPEEDVPGRNGRRQRFERGEIGWSPDQDMTVSVYRLRNEACFEWSTSRFHYDYFRYDVTYNGVGQGQANMQVRGPSRIWTRLQGFGEYAFTVKGCDEAGLFGSDECKQGWTIPVRLQLGPSAETPDPGGPKVSGMIAGRWHELGAWSGPLGKPIAEEIVNPAEGIHSQRFERGSISTAPEFGAGMVVAAYQRGRSIEVNWGGASDFFNTFRVDVYFNGRKFLEQLVTPFPTELARPSASGGQFRLDATRGDGLYWFYINPSITLDTTPKLAPSPDPDVTVDPVALGVDDMSHVVHFTFGSTPQVQVLFKPDPADAHLDPSAIDGSPAHAYASHRTRVSTIAKHYARTRPLYPRYEATGEDLTIKLIAHLQAAREDPEFRSLGELPSRILAPVALREVVRGKVGTKADYDMTLKGLMTIAYRYRRNLLTEDDLDFLLRELVPGDLAGAHDPDAEVYADAPGPLVAPETENHQLMIESTRYLVNQLLLDRTGDQIFNNRTNGLTDWLLGFMHTIAKHDFLEFNSRPYQRLSVHALLNLHEFAKDTEIRTAAQILLDYTTVKFAISSNRQRRIGPFRRLKERTNRPDDARFNELLLSSEGDPHTGFFLMYAGPTGRDGTPTQWFPDVWVKQALIAGLAAYRPPPAAYILAMTRHAPAQHRFYHGERPRLQGWPAPERADGGVEIYYSSPSFLLTAGGMFLNSGYGHDEFTGYEQVAIAQSTTLLPTRADVTFADLIRFDRYPDERQAVNTAVHFGFACGANLQIPEKWLDLTGTSDEGPWCLLDLNRDMPGYGRLGLYVAAYRTATFLPTPPDGSFLPPLENPGFLYAIESDAMDFETFSQRTRDRNATLPATLELGGTYVFNTPDDSSHNFTFRLLPYGERYKARILKMDSQQLPEDLTSLPLVDGPYLKAPGGHDGFLEVRHPGCDAPLVLDFRNATNPVRLDNALACPEPLFARAQALILFALKIGELGRHQEAVAAAQEAVSIYRGLGDEPGLAWALAHLGGRLWDLPARREEAITARREVTEIYRRLAGTDPATPQYQKYQPELATALILLALALGELGRHQEAVAAAQEAVSIYRGLGDEPGLAWALAHLAGLTDH
jgi:hypothetical protein